MDEGSGGFGEGADQMDQFHRNEAISAVADEGFLGEEDEDYEDLYNDVNVGEGFLQSLRKGEELGLRNEEEKKKESLPRAAPDQHAVSIPSVGEGSGNGGGGDVGEVRLSGFQSDQGFRGNVVKGTVGSGSGGIRVELGQGGITNKMNEVEDAAISEATFLNSFGLYLMGWFIFTFLLLICTLRSTVAFFSLFFTLDMAFLMLGIGYLQNDGAHPQEQCIIAGGAFGLMAAFLAWYNALAGIADSSNSFFVIPVAHFPWSDKGRERREKVDNSAHRAA